jgi:hypothetical protein
MTRKCIREQRKVDGAKQLALYERQLREQREQHAQAMIGWQRSLEPIKKEKTIYRFEDDGKKVPEKYEETVETQSGDVRFLQTAEGALTEIHKLEQQMLEAEPEEEKPDERSPDVQQRIEEVHAHIMELERRCGTSWRGGNAQSREAPAQSAGGIRASPSVAETASVSRSHVP